MQSERVTGHRRPSITPATIEQQKAITTSATSQNCPEVVRTRPEAETPGVDDTTEEVVVVVVAAVPVSVVVVPPTSGSSADSNRNDVRRGRLRVRSSGRPGLQVGTERLRLAVAPAPTADEMDPPQSSEREQHPAERLAEPGDTNDSTTWHRQP